MNNVRFAILGTGGHGLAALDAALLMDGVDFVGWIDSFKSQNEIVGGYPVLGHPDALSELIKKHNIHKIFLAVSHNFTRMELWKRISRNVANLELLSIIHPNSSVSKTAVVGKGSLVMSGAIVAAGCTVGENCIIDLNSVLDHDSILGSYASLLPSTTTGGNVSIGICTCICLGSLISHRLSIGEHSFVGAGSVVLKNIPEKSLVYGYPAKLIRQRSEDEKHF